MLGALRLLRGRGIDLLHHALQEGVKREARLTIEKAQVEKERDDAIRIVALREKDLDKLSPQEKEDFVAEEKMVKDLINQTFEKFKAVVAEGRQQANKKNKEDKDAQGQALDQNWTDYADGRVLSGKEAFELGFVDELGNFDTAVKRARKLAKIEKANLVQYQQLFDLSSLFRLLGKSEAPKIKIDVGLEAPKLKVGQLYFLSPTFAH